MFFANADPFPFPARQSKQAKRKQQRARTWFDICTPRLPHYRNFIVPRLPCAISKKWITGRSKTRSASPMAPCAEFSAAPWLQCANNFAPLSLQRTESMATVHAEIDNWLTADLYEELSGEEQRQLHTHLVDCADCRKTHQETKAMNKILEETLAQQKPDPAFEQRMLAAFRNRIPEKAGLLKLLADLMRLRAAQVTAVAAVLLGLVALGGMMTRESATTPLAPERQAKGQLIEGPTQVAARADAGRAGALDKSEELAAGKPKDLALAPPPAASQTQS